MITSSASEIWGTGSPSEVEGALPPPDARGRVSADAPLLDPAPETGSAPAADAAVPSLQAPWHRGKVVSDGGSPGGGGPGAGGSADGIGWSSGVVAAT